MKPPKIGLILECGPQGADKKVCEHLIKTFFLNVELGRSITLDQKPKLLADCGEAAKILIEEGHDRVVIVWDLYPAWREDGQKPCRKADREAAFASIAKARVSTQKTFLVCISEELESWLLADGSAISAFLSTPAHPKKIADRKKPDTLGNPKTKLTQLMQEHRGRLYVDRDDAIKIVKFLGNLNKVRRSESFKRFEDKVNGL